MSARSNEAIIGVANNEMKPCVGRGLTTPVVAALGSEACRASMLQAVKRWLFARFTLLKSSPFRLGFFFWVLFSLSFGIGLNGFYQTLQARMLDRIDGSITERFSDIQRIYAANGLESVIQLAEARSVSPMASSMGFHLSTGTGERIAGNVPLCITESGWDVLTGEDLGMTGDTGQYRFYTSLVGDNLLSLGRSLNDLQELRSIAIGCMLLVLAVSTLLAFMLALVFAQRAHVRVSGISKALDNVAAGHLLARLPVTPVGDDIDQLSEKINGSLERLQYTVEGMRQVSTDIAHDLKTPLNRLFITIGEASDKSRKGICVGEDLDRALDEAQSINGTFEALLRIAQIEAGARKSQFKAFDVYELLETAVEVYTPVVEEQGQSLHVTAADAANGALSIMGDRNLMLQLLVNLIENAVNHCGEKTQISVSAGRSNDQVWLSVADTGPGIPEHEREKVFQRLYRLERSRTTRGDGVGFEPG